MKTNKNIIYYYLYVISSAALLTRGIFLLYLQEKGLSIIEVSMYSAIFNICSAIGEVPTGYIGDRIGRRNSLVIGVVLLSIQSLLMVILEENILLILCGGLEAIAYTFVSGSDSALLYNLLDEQGKKKDYLKINTQLLAVQAVVTGSATFVGAQLVKYSWTLPYYITVLLLVGSLVFLFRIKESKIWRNESISKVNEGIVRNNILFRPISIFLIFFLGISIIDGIMGAYYNLNQIIFTTMGYKVSIIGLFYSLSYFCNALAYLVVNFLSACFKRVYIIASALAVICVGFFALAKVNNRLIFMIISLILCFIPEIIFSVADSIIQDHIIEKNRATILSIMSLIRSIFSGIIYGFFGVALEIISFKQFFVFLGIGMSLGLLVSLLIIFKYVYKRKNT